MKQLLIYWGFLAAGYILGSKLRYVDGKFEFVQKLMMGAIYVLVVIMGLRMGVNEQVTSNLGSIGLQSLVITVFCVGGSMLGIFMTRKLLKIDRYGNLQKGSDGNINDETGAAEEKQESSDDSKLDIKSTVVILVLVAGGMLFGAFAIVGMMPDILHAFDVITNKLLVIFLCVLLFIVGFDLGLSGNVAANIKAVGARAFTFPFAAVLGSLVFGVISGLFFGFSVKEGIAISAGFGWYTYAPNIIAGAGSRYTVAGAVSFMHNVIRETSGLVLIPLLAKKFGYIEAAGVPGVAAMDVCMPIVERACRADTVVYSFAIGLVMCVATSVLVPLVMGI